MTEEIRKKTIEDALWELPLVQYCWLQTDEIPFSERVRVICREECPRYGTSWSCPPGVGTVEQCRNRCMEYEGAFIYSTIAEVTDITNMEETLATRSGHESVTRRIREIFRKNDMDTLALSGESCHICSRCGYPEEPCRFPEKMIPCVEGYGIVVPLLAEKTGMVFENGSNVVTWFGMILYKKK